MTLLNDIQVWTTACEYDRLIPGRGVGVLLDDGSQAALFRLDDGTRRQLTYDEVMVRRYMTAIDALMDATIEMAEQLLDNE